MRVVFVPTTTVTLTVRIGLTTDVLSVTSTRYCVVSGTESRAKEKPPWAFVSWTLPTLANAVVNGNGFCCSWIGRPALPVPESVPASVEGAPKAHRVGRGGQREPERLLGRREGAVAADRGAHAVVGDEAVVVLRVRPEAGDRRGGPDGRGAGADAGVGRARAVGRAWCRTGRSRSSAPRGG